MLAIALAAASCMTPSALLDANRAATLTGHTHVGTLTIHSLYTGNQLTGDVRRVVDLASGSFVDSAVIGPTQEAHGFDGKLPWIKDASAFYLPEQGGDELALAITEAYRNANAWWRKDRGGATLAPLDCNSLRVTPPGGEPFDAWFDPASHLLLRTRERESFGDVVETRYSAYAPRGDEQIATRIDIETNNNSEGVETLRLQDFVIGPGRHRATFAMPKDEPRDWTLSTGTVTVPFRLLNNHVIVEARVNGRSPLPFLVDTGGHDIITPSTAAALGICVEGKSLATGAGEKTATSGYASVESLQVGDALLSHQTVTVLDFSPPDVEGLQLGGMIGVEFFERFIIQIDYGARTISLIDPAHFLAADRARAGTPVPFRFYSHMPEVIGRLDGHEALFNIDTGSRSELTLTSPFVDKAGLHPAYPNGITITDGWGVGGPSRSYVVRAGELDLGSVKVTQPVVGLSAATRGAFSDPSYQGNVGSGLLKRFIATFDYRDRGLYLKPASYHDPDIGGFDRVGVWLNQAEGGFRIMDVAPGGPADQAGLKVGDLVIALDGASVLGEALSDVRRSLKLVPVGKRLVITARRGAHTLSATVTPRNLIPQ